MKLTHDIVEESNNKSVRELTEELLKERKNVVLSLPRLGHISEPEDSIMAAGDGHDSGIIKELLRGLRAFLIGSYVRFTAEVKHFVCNMQAGFVGRSRGRLGRFSC